MYDPSLSYEENYENGPFPQWCLPSKRFPIRRFAGVPRYSFFGNPVYLPFGIPAGPLLNSRFVRVAWNAGVSTCTYKTVRSRFWKSHPYPNVLQIRSADGSAQINSFNGVQANKGNPKVWGNALTLDSSVFAHGYDGGAAEGLSISNSFGVPSKDPVEWQEDVRQCLNNQSSALSAAAALAAQGRCLVLSFQGSRLDSDDFEAFVEDSCLSQDLAYKTFVDSADSSCLLQTVPVLELNLSCPNEVGKPLFTHVEQSLRLLNALKLKRLQFAYDVKLIAKIGSLSQTDCDRFVAGSLGLIDGISAINTVTAEIRKSQGGEIALGSGMLTGGVCGDLIFEENLAMVKKLAASRKRFNIAESQLSIISVGGIHSAERFMQVLEAGASHAQSATACMWNLDLCAKIAARLGVEWIENP